MTSARPTVSVVIPSYDRAHTLPRAIKSVRAQTYKDWELIVVDDGSNDETERTMKGNDDPRIRYLRHDRNFGAARARNTGIDNASGTYVAFLDSDDEWLPNKLTKDVSTFELRGKDIGLVYCGAFVFDDQQRALETTEPRLEGRIFSDLLGHDFIDSCSKVTVRTDVLRFLGGFDPALPSQQDWDLWLRVAKQFAVACVPDFLVKLHLGPNRISTSLRRIYEGTALVVRKYRSEMTEGQLANHLARLAMMLLNYDPPRGRELAFQALSLRPYQPTLLAALTTSLFGIGAYRRVFSTTVKFRHGVYVGRARI
jgi:glycosyltransferase involved in cell wall biosynthesis